MPRLLAWAARARSNPNFEEGDREFRFAIARLARDILDTDRADSLADRIDSLFAFMAQRAVPQIAMGHHLAPLRDWAADDEQGLAGSLEVFRRTELPPEERVTAFAESLQARESAGEDGEAAALAIGSLFNFATTPEDAPLLRMRALHGLAGLLGEPAPAGSIAEHYARHVEFIRRMHREFAGAGIPVRDLIDTEALLLVCYEDREFWTHDEDARRPRGRAPDSYLAACAIYRDEGPYLAEWIEFHRLVGVERFYLYDNRSRDDHREVLAPYVAEGIVVLHDWDMPHIPGQVEAYEHCIAKHGDEARWIAFLDLDEFLFSPTYQPLPEILAEYEQWPGVAVNLATHGPSGHRAKPAGLVIESYLTHIPLRMDRLVKSVVDPVAVENSLINVFTYQRRSAVDENGYPVHDTATKTTSFERLRINHYFWKSEEELLRKASHRTDEQEWKEIPETRSHLSPADRRQRAPSFDDLIELEAERGIRDETILPYATGVREALARRRRVGSARV